MKYNLLSFLCAATVIAYLQRLAISVPTKQIEKDLGLGPDDLGLAWLAWYVGYALFQIPAGIIADRFGSKPALIGFAVVWSVLTAVTGTATNFTELCAWWGLMGVAQAGIFVCATKAISATFEKTQQAFASGALACCMACGGAISQYVTGQLLGPLTWQEILALYMVPGLVWSVVFALFVPRPDAPVPWPERAELAPDPSEDEAWEPPPTLPPVPWARLLTDSNMILLCVQQFMRAGAAALFFTWFPRYLQETKGVSVSGSGSLAAMPLLAGMCGGLVGGILSDWLLRRTTNPRLSRQGLACLLTSTCALVAAGAYFTADATTAVLLISVAACCAYAAGVNAYALSMTMGGKRVAVVFATMNMSGNFGAGLFPYAAGLLGSAGYWNLMILLFAGMFATAAICWAFLNPKGTLFEEQP